MFDEHTFVLAGDAIGITIAMLAVQAHLSDERRLNLLESRSQTSERHRLQHTRRFVDIVLWLGFLFLFSTALVLLHMILPDTELVHSVFQPFGYDTGTLLTVALLALLLREYGRFVWHQLAILPAARRIVENELGSGD